MSSHIVYNPDSFANIITIFSVECAIIFGLIFLTLCCCIGNSFTGDKNNKNKNPFNFKKYSSESKIDKTEIKELFDKNNSSLDPKAKIDYFESIKKIICCCSKKSIPSNNLYNTDLDSELDNLEKGLGTKNTIRKQKELEDEKEGLSKEKQDILVNNHEGKPKNKPEETKEFDDSDNPDKNKDKNKDKIYLIWEFNNLDKVTKSSGYLDSEGTDEFDELEEFVNMILKSFKKNYSKVGVLLKISSPGGSAYKFEHAYLNLQRLRDKGVQVIGIVDKMAASGGYMLAMGCDKVICSKYAIIGSVGVIAQLYNWADLSKKVGVEEKTWTTGSHKSLFPMGSSYTEEDVERVNEMIGDTFVIFKDIVEKSRKFTPEQLEQIFKAKTFYGLKALELNMVDQIAMGNEFIEELEQKHNIWICYKEKQSKSLVNSLLYENVKNIGIGLSKYYQHVKTHNQVDNIKLL